MSKWVPGKCAFKPILSAFLNVRTVSSLEAVRVSASSSSLVVTDPGQQEAFSWGSFVLARTDRGVATDAPGMHGTIEHYGQSPEPVAPSTPAMPQRCCAQYPERHTTRSRYLGARHPGLAPRYTVDGPVRRNSGGGTPANDRGNGRTSDAVRYWELHPSASGQSEPIPSEPRAARAGPLGIGRRRRPRAVH